MSLGLVDGLTTLAPQILAAITGERRRRLIEYLLRWGEPAAAIAAIDHWLAQQPHLATLREARARALLDLGQHAAALDAIDAIDAERGASESRRFLRIRALSALGRWSDATALIPDRPVDPATWRARAELLRHQGHFDEAVVAYQQLNEILPEGSAPLRGLAELALERGDPPEARRLLDLRLEAGESPPTVDLFLLRRVALALGDDPALAALDAQLAQRRSAEQAALSDELGLDLTDSTETPNSLEPQPLMPQEPHLSADAYALLHEHFGYQSFRPGQAAAIAAVLGGTSALAVLPTGAGKSLTYQLPALLLPGATVVLSPLIALMKDQVDNLPTALAACATSIHSALNAGEIAARLRGVAAGRYRLVYVAPERLRQQPFIHALRRAGVARVVVDEAHCVSLWGISFRPDYLFINRAVEMLGAPPVLALTATATPETEREIKAQLAQVGDGAMPTIRTSVYRPNLRFEVNHVANKQEKEAEVVALCQAIDGPVVVYARSRESCELLAARLRSQGVAAEHYHAQAPDRAERQDRFMRGATRVLAATVAFGMGIDKADIRAIIHYNLPPSVEAYYQEAGRAGRDGLAARCILLYAAADKGQLTSWLREEALSITFLREVYRWLRRGHGSWRLAPLDDLRRQLREEDDTRIRVALGMLERVGLLRRHFDLPRVATVTLRDQHSDDARFHAFAAAAGLKVGVAVDLDLIALAEHSDRAPDELERWLLDWHDQGKLRYEGAAREVLIELRPAPADVAEQLDALLAEYAARQDSRLEAIAGYARRASCRHRALAQHFGERLPACGSACDICAPADANERRVAHRAQGNSNGSRRAAPAMVSDVRADELILHCLATLPFAVGRSGLAKILKGAAGSAIGPERCTSHGALAGWTLAAIEEAIDRLLTRGLLERRENGVRPLLALTERGAVMLYDSGMNDT